MTQDIIGLMVWTITTPSVCIEWLSDPVKAVLVGPHMVNGNPGIPVFRIDRPRRVTGTVSGIKWPHAPASGSRDSPNVTHRGIVDRYLAFHHN